MLSGPLKLDQTYIKKNIILKSYGLNTTKDVFYEKKHTDIIFYVEENVYFNDEKITTLFSSKAKPLVHRYKFIRDFEDVKEGYLAFTKGNI